MPRTKTGKEQNKRVWIKSYSTISEKTETNSKEMNMPTPPNLEIDFLCKVCGLFLTFEMPNLTLILSRKIKNTPIKKDIGNISVIKIIQDIF